MLMPKLACSQLTSEVGTQQLQTGSEEGFEQQLWQAVDGTQQVRRPASAGDVLKSDGSGEAPRVGRKEWMAFVAACAWHACCHPG